MIKRTCLLIDDEKQDDVFPTIITEGLKHGLDIECLQLNVGNQAHREFLEKEEISLEKVVSVFQKKFNGVKIDLMAFDWNIGSGIKGPEIIGYFNQKSIRPKVPKMLYSGALKDEIEKLLSLFKEGKITFKDIWAQINTLIKTNALVFEDRDTYEIGIVEQLKKIENSFDLTIDQELRKFPSFRFKSSFVSKQFQGKTFNEIAQVLEHDITLKNNFTSEITEQVIAYLTERINAKPKNTNSPSE